MGWLSALTGSKDSAGTSSSGGPKLSRAASTKTGFQIEAKFDHQDLQPVELRPKKAKTALIPREQALPGRPEPLEVSDRHYVLQTPMKGPWPENYQVCVFANGCFWGSEKGFWRLPGGGVHSTAVGYAGGFTPNPTYEEVCSGQTGHTEAVQVVFDPAKISLVDLLRWFWESHDPTQGMGQGNDRGTQYRSAFYYFTEEQRQIFEASKASYQRELAALGKGKGPNITTELKAASDFPDSRVFFYAEDEHQQYLAKPGARPYCSAQPLQVSLRPFEEWAQAELKSKFAPKLGDDFWRLHGPKPHCVINAPTAPIQWSSSKAASAKKKPAAKAKGKVIKKQVANDATKEPTQTEETKKQEECKQETQEAASAKAGRGVKSQPIVVSL